MHYKDLLRSIARVGYYILVPDFYLMLHGLICRKKNFNGFINQSIICTPDTVFSWLCLTSHRQLGHLETAPPFTVPCEGSEARLIHRSDRDLNPGPSHGSPLRYRCATQAPHPWYNLLVQRTLSRYDHILKSM